MFDIEELLTFQIKTYCLAYLRLEPIILQIKMDLLLSRVLEAPSEGRHISFTITFTFQVHNSTMHVLE